jgi:hypothetical protein
MACYGLLNGQLQGTHLSDVLATMNIDPWNFAKISPVATDGPSISKPTVSEFTPA